MTTDPISTPIQIQAGDYLIRSGRVLVILDVIGDGEHRAYSVAKVEGANPFGANGKLWVPPQPLSLGRKSTLRASTLGRDCRYAHVPAADVAQPSPDPVEVPEVPANDPIPTDPHPDLVAALERNTRMVARLVASVDLLREAIEKHGIRGQLTIPALVKAVG